MNHRKAIPANGSSANANTIAERPRPVNASMAAGSLAECQPQHDAGRPQEQPEHDPRHRRRAPREQHAARRV